MKSAVFHGKCDVRVEEVPIPVLEDDDVLVKVMACGVCGTDVHIFHGDKGAGNTVPPLILGHELSGIVEKVGKNVTEVVVGDHVCVDPNQNCGECYYCRNGLAHYCTARIGYGTMKNGGFSQYMKAHKKVVYKVRKDLSFIAAAAAEPVSCCLHGIDLCQIQPGDTVLVIGAGMIGLINMQLAKICGASTLIMMEPVERKRELAMQLGADFCIDPKNEDPASTLKAHRIERVNVVIECVGLPATVSQAISLAGNKARVMLFGLTKPDDEVAIKPFSLFEKETTILTSFINPYTIGRALDLISSGKIDVTTMVLDPIPLETLPAALEQASMRSQGKVIVDPWKEA